MTNDEVNKIIAEYMEYCIRRCGSIHIDENCGGVDFCYSLDSLVPVWECIGLQDVRLFWHTDGHSAGVHNSDVSGFNLTIQEAAAHATAKAIISLNNQ